MPNTDNLHQKLFLPSAAKFEYYINYILLGNSKAILSSIQQVYRKFFFFVDFESSELFFFIVTLRDSHCRNTVNFSNGGK